VVAAATAVAAVREKGVCASRPACSVGSVLTRAASLGVDDVSRLSGQYAGSSLLGRAPPMWGQWPDPYGGGLGPAQPMWPPSSAPQQFYPPAGAHGYYGAPGGGAYDDGHEGGPAWTPGVDDGNNEDDDEEDDVPFDSIDLEAETALKDTWMASARNCTCCKGYVYGCSGETCNALGVCVCTAGDMIEAENSERTAAQANTDEPEVASARAPASGVDR